MPTFDVAHIREQNQDLIIVLVDKSFGLRASAEQNRTQQALQACARSAGLAGTVVPVWDNGDGGMRFLAPRPWHPFFEGLTLAGVAAWVNRTLTCS